MSDIDFDELDRAVASVLDKEKPAATPQPSETTAEPVTVNRPAPAQKPVSGESEVTPVTVTVNTPAPVTATSTSDIKAVSAQALHAQPVRPVQRGRFLDMVHTAPTVPPARPVSVAPAVRPAPAAGGAFVSDVIAPATPSAAPSPVSAPVSVAAPAVPESETQPAPAPDFFAPAQDSSVSPKIPEITSSPFIADAKVEKRPLGSWAGTDKGVDDIHRRVAQVEREDNIVAEPADTPIVPAVIQPAPVAVKPKKAKKQKAASPALVAGGLGTGTEKLPKHGNGALIWITVAVAVLLIGFGVGATLYFNVLR